MTAATDARAAGDTDGRPARPVRFEDPVRNAAYWARIDRIISEAPPFTPDQKARIRAAFHQPAMKEAS